MKKSIAVLLVVFFVHVNAYHMDKTFESYCEDLLDACPCVHDAKSMRADCSHAYTKDWFTPFMLTMTGYCRTGIFDFFSPLNARTKTLHKIGMHKCEPDQVLTSRDVLNYYDAPKAKYVSFSNDMFTINEQNANAKSGANEVEIIFWDNRITDTFLDKFANYTTITFQALHLDEVPSGLFNSLMSLKYLIWKNENCKTFDNQMLRHLPKLENLTISFVNTYFYHDFLYMTCDTLQLNFITMTKLKEVKLLKTFCNDEYISDFYFNGAVNLISIEISGNYKLKYLPERLFADQHELVSLDLSSNSLESLPVYIFENMSKLAYLNLSMNHFTEISSLQHLNNLIVLDISMNKELTTLTDLTTRKLKFLNAWDTEVWLQSNLQNVFICHAKDSCDLLMDINNVTCPPKCNCYLERLTLRYIIDCDHMNYKQLPNLPVPLAGVSILHIENNYLKELPDATQYGYAQLSEIHATNNILSTLKLTQIPQNIKHLDISHNNLSILDDDVIDWLMSHKQNLSLKLAGNPWRCNCAAQPFLRFVKQMFGHIRDIGQLHCQNGTHVKPLGDLDLHDICPVSASLNLHVVYGCVIGMFALLVLLICYRHEIKDCLTIVNLKSSSVRYSRNDNEDFEQLNA